MSRSIQSNPRINLPIVAAQTDVGASAQRVLFVGQQTASGSATSGELTSDIQNDGSWDGLYGENSMLAAMIRNFRLINIDVNIDAIPLDDDGGAVDATGTFTITGPATEAGTITFDIGSSRNHSFEIAIADTDTATVIGDALAAAITADTKVPVTAVNAVGVVTLTAVNGGTEGNSIGMQVSGEVAGVAVAIVGMASGATDPDLTGLFDVVGNTRYQTVVWPFAYGTTDIKAFLDPRFNSDNKVLDGVAILHSVDTFANLQTAGNAENSQSLMILGNKLNTGGNTEGSGLLEISTVISSQFAAIRSIRHEDGTNIAEFVIATNGLRDTRGGDALASFPYFNTPFRLLPLITPDNGFSDQELQDLLTAGISNLGLNTVATLIIAGQIKTTYKTDAAGNPDASFGFLNFVDTISKIREIYFNRLRARYAQSRLTEGTPQQGRSMANADMIRAFCIGIFQDLSSSDFVLMQSGETALNFYKSNLTVTLDLETGLVTITMKAPIVTQLREITGAIQIVFSTEE